MKEEIIDYDKLVFKPEKQEGFKDFCLAYYDKVCKFPPTIKSFYIPTEDGEDILFEFLSHSLVSADCFYSDICNSLSTFNLAFLDIVKDDSREFKREYIKCYQTEHDNNGYSYLDYLKYNNGKIITATCKYFEEEAIGESYYEEYKQTMINIKNKRKNSPNLTSYAHKLQHEKLITAPFVSFNNPIPFIKENEFSYFDSITSTPKAASKLKIELDHTRKFLRLASICQARKYIFKYLASSSENKNHDLVAKIWEERCDKWIYAAEVHVEKISSTMTSYYLSSSQGKDDNTRKETENKNYKSVAEVMFNILKEDKKLKKSKGLEDMTKQQLFKEIKAAYMIKFKSIKLTNETIKKHIKKYIY